MTTFQLRHPELGSITGRTHGDINQFLGIKYASLKDRFAAPQLLSKYEGESLDATKIGYGDDHTR